MLLVSINEDTEIIWSILWKTQFYCSRLIVLNYYVTNVREK